MISISVKEKLNFDNLPKHVAIIMDGNGRWAKSQNKERTFGHKNAIKAVREAISACNEVNIPYLTLYTFSTENWNRPTEEVDTLMNLLSSTLLQEAEEIFSKGIRIRAIGDLEALPEDVRNQLYNIMVLTKNNTKGNLTLALSYGSQKEILNAVKELCKKVKNGDFDENDIDEKLFDAVVAVSGSSPAYVFMFIEAMADAAVLQGMARDKAYRFAAQAVLGSAKMVLDTNKHPGALKDMVCSPGGTTIEGVAVLEEKGMRSAVIQAMNAVYYKSGKL